MTPCKVIAVAHEKGGTGKTTSAISIGAALAKRGKRVLLVDFDPQSSLTVSLGAAFPEELPESIADIMAEYMEHDDSVPSVEKALLHAEGMDILPSSIELAAIAVSLINAMRRECVLQAILSPLREQYDYIIIDCAPSMGILTINALAAADSVIIPMQAQFLSVKGVELLVKNIFRIKRQINPTLDIEGILVTMRDKRTKHGREVVSAIQEAYSGHVRIFAHEIPLSVRAAEASAQGTSVFLHAPDSNISVAYDEVVKEVLGNV